MRGFLYIISFQAFDVFLNQNEFFKMGCKKKSLDSREYKY